MTNLTPDELRALYKKLPDDVREAYFSVDTGDILQAIGKEKGLNVEKFGILADETGLLMLGLTRPTDFTSHLADRLEIDKEKAKEIAQEINVKVFSKIRDSLRQMHNPAPQPEPEKDSEKPISTVPHIINPLPTAKDMPEEKIIPTPEPETAKTIFEERTKEEIFRSKPEITKYPGGVDPYKEPIE